MLPTLLLLIGVASSGNLGERPPGFVGQAIVSGNRWEAQASVETTDKYTGAGWRGSGVAHAVLGPGVLLGAEYVHRNGGEWVKDTYWLRAGYARTWGPSTVHAVLRGVIAGDTTHERGLLVEYRRRFGRVVLATEQGLLAYKQPTWQIGYTCTVTMGVTFHGKEVGQTQ